MPGEDLVVHRETTALCCGPSWKFGVANYWCFCFRAKATESNPDPDPDPGSTESPSSNPLVDAPFFVLDVLDGLPKRSFPCHGWRNENVVWVFDSGASTTMSSDLGGVNEVCFGIPNGTGSIRF